jgi:hypothetical protein
MAVSGQLHVEAASPRERVSIHIGLEAGGRHGRCGRFWRRGKFLVHAGIRTSDRTVRSLSQRNDDDT